MESSTSDEETDVSSNVQGYRNFLEFLQTPSPAKGRTSSQENVNGPHDDFVEEHAIPSHDKGFPRPSSVIRRGTPSPASLLQWTARRVLFSCAFALAALPSVLKLYETSHWFREGDPSVYDEAKDWFSNPKLPLQPYFDNAKVLMRVYFFIVPYIVSALCVALGLGVPAAPSPLSQCWPRRACGTLLRRTVALPSCAIRAGGPLRVSVAELIGLVTFLTLNLLTVAVRIRRSLPRGSRKIEFLVDGDDAASRAPIDLVSWQACEVWAKTLGVISILNLGWYLLMPVGRKSILLEALNISWERAIKYHRWVGYYSVAIMIAHGIMYIGIWMHGDGHASYDPGGVMVESNLVPWYCARNECDEGQARMLRRNMYGLATLFLILVMTIFTLPWIRRQKFEWFYYAHHLFVLVLLFVGLHYKGAIIYLLPGITIYGVDKLMALHSYRKAAPVETRMLTRDVLEISFETKDGTTYSAGDYVFLNVPAVSFLQWHPFSITSAPAAHGKKVTFHLKNVGAGSWTSRVIKEATTPNNALKVRLDGFYGANSHCDQLRSKDGVVFVGGGVGVTPMLSLALEMCHTSSVPLMLLWNTRSVAEFAIFSTELEEAQRAFPHFRPKAWVTLSSYDARQYDRCDLLNEDECNFTRPQLLQFKNFTQSVRCVQRAQSAAVLAAPPTFILERQSLSGAGSAAVMTMSTTLALVAYALVAKTAREDSHVDTPQDFVSLVELSMVCVVVVLWVAGVIGMRHTLTCVGSSMKNLTSERKTNRSVGVDFEPSIFDSDLDPGASSSLELPEMRTATSGALSGSDNTESGDTGLARIIQGNIGCRVNIADELSSFARAVARNMERPVDIAVLASGPTKLVEFINDYINVPSTFCNLGVDKDQQAFFSFTEENWEW